MNRVIVTGLAAMMTTALGAFDTNAVARVEQVLLGQVSVDIPSDDAPEPSFADWYGEFMAETGCTSNTVFAVLAYIGTNSCAAAGGQADQAVALVQGAAICHLSKFDLRHEHMGALYYAVTNNARANAYNEVSALVGALGTGHRAFEEYNALVRQLPDRRASEIVAVIGRTIGEGGCPTSVTNRTVGLFLDAASLLKCSPVYADRTLCSLWPGYQTSSNRLQNINAGLGQDIPAPMLSFLETRKSELLALPPGTMQMLPTNQFYNVED